MDQLSRIIAIEDIKQLKARYFRYMDTKDWDNFRNVFTPDVVFNTGEAWSVRHPTTGEWQPPIEKNEISGRDNVVQMIREGVNHLHTVHHGHQPEIEIVSDTEARGIWAMEDLLRNGVGDQFHRLHAYGHYHEVYERLPTGWAIKRINLTRLYMHGDQ